MKLIPKNTNYVHPTTAEIIPNIFISEGEFSDIPLLEKLKISFWLCQNYTSIDFAETDGILTPSEVTKMRVLDSDTLEFTPTSETPTYVTKDGETKDLFVFLADGGQLDGTETIDVGYPNYTAVQNYLFKDNIGDSLAFHPDLDAMGLQLAKTFVLENWKINGEPIGIQFKFED